MKVTNVSTLRIYLKDLKFQPQAETEGRRGEDLYLEPSGTLQSAYLIDSSEVLRSCLKGDIKKHIALGRITLNDVITLASGASIVLTHNFNFLPHVIVVKQVGSTWVDATATFNAVHNAAYTTVTITNTTAFTLTYTVRLS
jgi:hypothetical protein